MNLPKLNGSKKPVSIILVLLVLIVGTAVVHAASQTAGSESDPVVTKSYVDSAVANASGAVYKVVSLEAGQTIVGGEGTEIILRSGVATALDNGSNGISDISSGVELWSGDDVAINHLILVPRNDGRGLTVQTDAYLMVRGTYTLK